MASRTIATEYKVVCAESVDDLVKLVNKLIDDHWDPIGGIQVKPGQVLRDINSITCTVNAEHCWQAMAKYS